MKCLIKFSDKNKRLPLVPQRENQTSGSHYFATTTTATRFKFHHDPLIQPNEEDGRLQGKPK